MNAILGPGNEPGKGRLRTGGRDQRGTGAVGSDHDPVGRHPGVLAALPTGEQVAQLRQVAPRLDRLLKQIVTWVPS